MYIPQDAIELSNEILEIAKQRKFLIATAESCTAGMISATLTEIPGSSAFFDRGFATYSNEAKCEMLDVPMDMIIEHGAVSEQVARAMADGAITHSNADFSVAVTGVAGPAGGSASKPVGLVHFAVSSKHHPQMHREKLFAHMNRENVRGATVELALVMLIEAMTQKPFISHE